MVPLGPLWHIQSWGGSWDAGIAQRDQEKSVESEIT